MSYWSHKGLCYDNAVMERFFLNLKMERVWQQYYANHQEVIRDVSHYITVFYNQVILLNYICTTTLPRIFPSKISFEIFKASVN